MITVRTLFHPCSAAYKGLLRIPHVTVAMVKVWHTVGGLYM